MNNSPIKLIKNGILTCMMLFLIIGIHAQKLDSVTISGKQYYVYPFPNQLKISDSYYLGINPEPFLHFAYQQGLKKNKDLIYEISEDDFVKKGAKRYEAYQKKYLKANKHINKEFIQAIRKNPAPLFRPIYELNSDIVPSLDQLPDGNYVQYFDEMMLIDSDGNPIFKKDIISGYFTLKNNILEGPAYWINIQGDTLKQGFYTAGIKTGDWKMMSITSNVIDEENAQNYILKGYPFMDTTIEKMHFENGQLNGHYTYFNKGKYPLYEGDYKKGEKSGQWIYRIDYITDYLSINSWNGRKIVYDNHQITEQFTFADKDTAVHQFLIRRNLIDIENPDEEESPYLYEPQINFEKIYSINFEKAADDSDLELEEEREDEAYIDYEDEYEYEEYMDDFPEVPALRSYSPEEEYQYDKNTKNYISVAKLMDSLGVVFHLKDTFQLFYPNGQCMMQYIFKDNKLVAEDTIFWDNGKPYDIVSFHADSNQYLRSVYDYYGNLYLEKVYDNKGNFVRLNHVTTNGITEIEGLKVEISDNEFTQFFVYDNRDSLEHLPTDSLLLYRSWSYPDASLLYSRSYVPETRTLTEEYRAIDSTKYITGEYRFSEDYRSWTGNRNYLIGPLKVHEITSASYAWNFSDNDTVPILHVNDFTEDFSLNSDFTLLAENQPFTGNLAISFDNKDFSFNTKPTKISMNFAKTTSDGSMKQFMEMINYLSKGKSKHKDWMSMIDETDLNSMNSVIYTNFMGGFLGDLFYNGEDEEYYYYDYEYEEEEGEKKPKKTDLPSKLQSITGKFLNGKPEGTWIAKDQFGKIIREVTFHTGEINGTLKTYDVAYPYNKAQNDYYYETQELADSFPKKKTYYLSNSAEYVNGIQQGEEISYNWYGKITEYANYKDGFKEGNCYERNNYAFTQLNYRDGDLNGHVKTFLTLPEKDSILLYDLQFADGNLQGESKAFHVNGKLAKHGYFLHGQPIEDYEAYDTLGFRYHYVKFLYSFPVEEKIWEENELSVRYQFDWKDSIYFRPSDITSTQSLDRLMAEYGIGMDYFERPYYGRQSLVDKSYIDYHLTKYYPNDTIARDGNLSNGKKTGHWFYNSYEGIHLYDVDYFDTIIAINDSVRFKSKGIYTAFNPEGSKLFTAYIIEKSEKYDCAHSDHYEIRQFKTIWEANDSVGRMNGYVKNYYDNGVLQSEGNMKNGLPDGVWKLYDPFGKLNQVGVYVMGKRDGRWLKGDLSKSKYLGDICLNPNLPDLEKEMKYREKLIDISIIYYKMGKKLNQEYYDVNLNDFEDQNAEDSESATEEE